MTKGKEESKPPVQINEDKNLNDTSRSNNLNAKKKKECDSSQKMNAKQKIKQRGVSKFQKVRQSSMSNILLKYNKKAYKYQIQQLNLLFKQSLKYPMLTQDELYILFEKYKSDGHYRTNKDLPSFTSFFVDTHNMFGEKLRFYNQFPDTQNIKSRNDGETIENSYYNENQHVEDSPKQDALKYAEIPPVNNINNRIQNKYLYNDQTFLNNSNYNHLYMNHNNIQHNDLNISNDMEHFVQSKLDSMKFSDTEETRFLHNLASSQDISEEYQNCSHMNKDLHYNMFNTQYENLTNSENLQQNNIHHSMHNNFSLNSNFYSDCYLNRCSNVTSINNNSNYHSLKNAQSICTPQINNMESNFDTKNSVASQQLPLMKDHLEEQGNLNFPIHTDTCSLNNKNLPHISNKDISNIQADFNAYSINSTMMSDDILSQTNAFIPLCASIVNQYN